VSEKSKINLINYKLVIEFGQKVNFSPSWLNARTLRKQFAALKFGEVGASKETLASSRACLLISWFINSSLYHDLDYCTVV